MAVTVTVSQERARFFWSMLVDLKIRTEKSCATLQLCYEAIKATRPHVSLCQMAQYTLSIKMFCIFSAYVIKIGSKDSEEFNNICNTLI